MNDVNVPDLSVFGNVAWSDNWTRGRGTLHGEILDPALGNVWLAQEAMTLERFESLAIPDGFVRSGIGEATADVAFFRRSPGADCDGPLETLEVDGVRFSLVARPGVLEAALPGLFILPVHKYHRVFYAAGRTLEIMDCGDGFDYVPLVSNAKIPGRRVRDDEPRRARILPASWSVRSAVLHRDLVVELPCPTRVTFFTSGDSFQGPVRTGV